MSQILVRVEDIQTNGDNQEVFVVLSTHDGYKGQHTILIPSSILSNTPSQINQAIIDEAKAQLAAIGYTNGPGEKTYIMCGVM